MALGGRYSLGNTNAPPSTGWQQKPGRLFTTSATLFTFRTSVLLMFCISCRRESLRQNQKNIKLGTRVMPISKSLKKSLLLDVACLRSHLFIKGVWGISWLWRVQHKIQGKLTQHRRTAVFGELCVDVFHNSGVQIYQLHISATQTTPGGREESPVSFSRAFDQITWSCTEDGFCWVIVDILDVPF